MMHALIVVFKMCSRWSIGSTDSCDQELIMSQNHVNLIPAVV